MLNPAIAWLTEFKEGVHSGGSEWILERLVDSASVGSDAATRRSMHMSILIAVKRHPLALDSD